jgi:Uma2 family endonuclease
VSAQPLPRLTYAEYLALEQRDRLVKHEYLRGEVWAMAGGTPSHGLLQSKLIVALARAIDRRPCEVFTSDVRVRVDETDRSTYPDAFVVCGPRQSSRIDPLAVINPQVIVEITSDSTEADDRGEKFAHYRRLDSLVDYVVVSHRQPRIDVFSRQPDGWVLRDFAGNSELMVPSIGSLGTLGDLYRDNTKPT